MIETARILVVDDEKMIREGCARILKKVGHEVVTANDGRQALDMVRQEHYDIILLDIKMPEVDGLEVMSILRQRKSDALIVVITGYATIETAVEAMKAGAYDLLIKPFSADALRISVGRALDHLRLALETDELRRLQAKSLKDIESEQSRVRTIMNSMACGILVTDNEKNLVLINPMAPQMLDLKTDSPLGRPMDHVVFQPQLVEMVGQLFNEDESYTALEQEIKISDNLWIRARSAPVRDSESSILGSVTVLADITHMKEMDRMKSEFVAMVSHELKAPLAAIQQQIDVLLAGIAGPINEKQTHFLSRAQTRAQGLIDLINQLLDLSRIEAGQDISRQEPLDLAPVIRKAVEFLQAQAEAKKQQLILTVPESLPRISADPRSMDEVVVNLVNNAIKYTPDEGRIEIQADICGNYVRIRVSDTGYGIPKDDLHRIFQKFFRVRSEKNRSISGTGLGLPIVKGIIEAHLGTIKVESELGQGTTFEILLPQLDVKVDSLAACQVTENG